MPYFADLTDYTYTPSARPMRNVGWLSSEHPFPRGPVPLAFAHELLRMSQLEPEELMRGVHVCELCQPPDDLVQAAPAYLEVWELFRSGNGELRVQGRDGVVYAAPTLLVHYVSEHQYQPPEAFVAAVLYQRELRS